MAAAVPQISVGERVGGKSLLAKALALVPADSHAAGRLLSLYGQVLGLQEGNYKDSKLALEGALVIAEREGDLGLQARTLANAANVELFQNNGAKALEFSQKVIELTRRVEEPRAEVSDLYIAALAAWNSGDLAGTRLRATAALSVAEKLRDRFGLPGALWPNHHVAYAEGDWTAAREFGDRGLAVSDHDPRLLYSRVQMEYELGEFSSGEVYLERLIETVRYMPPSPSFPHAATAMVIPTVGRVSGDESKYGIAQNAAEAVFLSGSATPTFEICARIGMGLITVSRGDVLEAQRQYQALASIIDAKA